MLLISFLFNDMREGYAAYYSEGVMQRVAENKGYDYEEGECMISLTEARYEETFGDKKVYVYGVNTGQTVECTVIDLPQTAHYSRIKNKGIEVEIPYEFQGDLCGHYEYKPSECPIVVWEID
jgi:hypothetical protein